MSGARLHHHVLLDGPSCLVRQRAGRGDVLHGDELLSGSGQPQHLQRSAHVGITQLIVVVGTVDLRPVVDDGIHLLRQRAERLCRQAQLRQGEVARQRHHPGLKRLPLGRGAQLQGQQVLGDAHQALLGRGRTHDAVHLWWHGTLARSGMDVRGCAPRGQGATHPHVCPAHLVHAAQQLLQHKPADKAGGSGEQHHARGTLPDRAPALQQVQHAGRQARVRQEVAPQVLGHACHPAGGRPDGALGRRTLKVLALAADLALHTCA